jgi:hypothetical protein
MLRKINGVIQFDANSDLHEWFVANPKVHGFCELFLRCNVSGGHGGTRKTARTLKDANGKAARFETFFPRGVFHCYQMQVQLGMSYKDGINRRIDRVGQFDLPEDVTFVADELPWGTWDIAGLVIMHTGGWYLRAYPTKDGFKELSETYVDHNGDAIDPVLWDLFVKEFKEEKKTSAKQASFGLATDDQLRCRTIKFESIQEMHIAGVKFLRVGVNPLGA